MSPVAVGAEEKRVTRCRVGLWDSQESRGAETRMLDAGERGEPGGQSEGGGKEKDEGGRRRVQLGWWWFVPERKREAGCRLEHTGGSEERRGGERVQRERGRERERGRGKPGTRILPKHPRNPGGRFK